jgi:hypothetical protein
VQAVHDGLQGPEHHAFLHEFVIGQRRELHGWAARAVLLNPWALWR